MSDSKTLILDSQAVFDWLLFQDPVTSGWSALLRSGAWTWVHTAEMKAEFDAVLRKGFGPKWPLDAARLAAVAEGWRELAHEVPEPPPLGADRRLACTDRDDQKFIDLGLALPAHTLVSRDKALLRLARKALARQGLNVLTPSAWTASLAVITA